jgi:hypothetical protein
MQVEQGFLILVAEVTGTSVKTSRELDSTFSEADLNIGTIVGSAGHLRSLENDKAMSRECAWLLEAARTNNTPRTYGFCNYWAAYVPVFAAAAFYRAQLTDPFENDTALLACHLAACGWSGGQPSTDARP